MTFDTEEKYALAASGIAASMPVVIDKLALDAAIQSVADSVLEGDTSRASTATSAMFLVLGALGMYLALRQGVDGYAGVSLVAVSTAFLALGGLAFLDN
jgi:hypothetical protein